MRLFDTAGLRETEDVIEAHGVELTRSLSQDADVVLYLCDSSVGLIDDDIDFLKSCKEPVILVWNKCDKESNVENLEQYNISMLKTQIKISAKSGTGLSDLYQAIKSVITTGITIEKEQAGLGSARQKDCVQEALESVIHAQEVAKEFTLDAVVQDLEEALNCLGEITGEVTPDDVLGSIFSHFCVGK